MAAGLDRKQREVELPGCVERPDEPSHVPGCVVHSEDSSEGNTPGTPSPNRPTNREREHLSGGVTGLDVGSGLDNDGSEEGKC